MRKTIQTSAYQQVFDEYRQQVVEDEWMQQITKILAKESGLFADK